MISAEQLASSLSEHDTVDPENQFAVSLAEARRVYRPHAPEEEGRYMLLLVSAGVAAGAEKISVERSGHTYRLAMEKAYIGERELLQAVENPQNCAPNSSASELASAMRRAFNERAVEISVRVGASPGSKPYARVFRADNKKPKPTVAPDWRGVEVEISFEPSWGQQFKGFLASLGGFVGMPAEERLVDTYADLCVVPITINKQAATRPLKLPVSPATALIGEVPAGSLGFKPDRRIDSKRWKGGLALGEGPVSLLVNGVSYGKLEGIGMAGVVFRDDLLRDASKEKLVTGDGYAQLLEELQVVRCRLFDVLGGKLENMRLMQVEPYLAELVHLYLLERLDLKSRQAIWNWMVAQFPPEKCRGVERSVVGLVMLCRLLIPDRIPHVVSAVLEDCADAVEGHHHGTHKWLKTAILLLRALPGAENQLLVGYLLLASGALHALNANKVMAEKEWLQALKTAQAYQGKQAAQLFRAHLEYAPEHAAREAARVLRMFGRSYIYAPD